MATNQKSKAEPKAEPTIEPAEDTTTEELSSDEQVELPEVQFVKYVGSADRRILTSKDLMGLGVQGDTLEWNSGNEHMLRADLIPADVVTALLKLGEFKAI